MLYCFGPPEGIFSQSRTALPWANSKQSPGLFLRRICVANARSCSHSQFESLPFKNNKAPLLRCFVALARLKGFEPPTVRIGICYSIQLSYRRIFSEPSLRIFNRLLCRLLLFAIFLSLKCILSRPCRKRGNRPSPSARFPRGARRRQSRPPKRTSKRLSFPFP